MADGRDELGVPLLKHLLIADVSQDDHRARRGRLLLRPCSLVIVESSRGRTVPARRAFGIRNLDLLAAVAHRLMVGGTQQQVDQFLAVDQAVEGPGFHAGAVEAEELLGPGIGQHELIVLVDYQNGLGNSRQNRLDLLGLVDGSAATDLQGSSRLFEVLEFPAVVAKTVANLLDDRRPGRVGRHRGQQRIVVIPPEFLKIDLTESPQIAIRSVESAPVPAAPEPNQADGRKDTRDEDSQTNRPRAKTHGRRSPPADRPGSSKDDGRCRQPVVPLQAAHPVEFPQFRTVRTAHHNVVTCQRRTAYLGSRACACRKWTSAPSSCPSLASVQPIKK